jgi:hypothetical protein
MPFPFIALGISALVGAGISALWAVAEGKPVTWQVLATGAAGGLVGFGVGGAILGKTSSVVLANVVGGGAGSGTSQLVDNAFEGRPLGENVAEATLIGGVVGGAVTPLVPIVTKATGQVVRAVTGAADDVRPGAIVSSAADDVRPGVAAVADDARPVAGLADDVRPVNATSEAMPPYALGPPVRTVPTSELRFSQTSAGGKGRADELRQSMGRRGYDGEPVDVVQTPGGYLTTIDNTRVAVARELGIENIPVAVHSMDELLPPSMLRRGWGKDEGPRFGENARTWGDALRWRTSHQSAQNGQPFPEYGSTVVPYLPKPRIQAPASETVGLAGALSR